MQISRRSTFCLPLVAVVSGLLAASSYAQEGSPNESNTWFRDAAAKLALFDGPLKPSGAAVPLSDAELASRIYDTLQEETTAGTLENLAKLEFAPPPSLKADSPQVGIYHFVQLGHLQFAYMPMFAKMSAQAADDLFKKAKSPFGEAAWNSAGLSRLWIRLGEVDKALGVLDETSSLYVEERCDLIRRAFAAAKAKEARALADSTLEFIRKTNPDITDTHARHLSHLVLALCDSGEIDRAREVMKELPPSEDALSAHRAICAYDVAHGEEELFAKDLGAMVEMLSKMDEFDSNQSSACVKAAEICVKFRRDAEAVKCFDRLDELSNQPDPPLTLPITWAQAARMSLYTTANDRADRYVERCTRSIAADKDATESDKLESDIETARVYAVRGNIAEFDKRMTDINARLKTTKSYLASSQIRGMYAELARVTRDPTLLGTIQQIIDQKRPGDGQIALAMVRRLIRTGEYDAARTLSASIDEDVWRLRATIDVIEARVSIPDENEQLAALNDANAIQDPRVSAYVLFAIGAKISGNVGYLGDALMRTDVFE